ncbi:TIGR02587 family membrane protein [Phenylobacterium sp.]|uniref:TIGR02587 family membrane protein n=1 Tax=Phenylobacterium sp. TaxID=1871053 RepID=UPI00286E09EE|nr:TIGR02587 family membrane protein [Phenylobacterium sp.]
MDQASREYGKGLARAFGGALLFALPLLMTMELWSLGGFAIDRARLLLFILVSLPMLLGLSYYAGFEPTFRLRDEVLDALAAFAVGFIVATLILTTLGVLTPDHSLAEMVGKIAVTAVPASIGALLAGKQFGSRDLQNTRERDSAGFLGILFLMSVGAIFLAFNIAPTEEVMVISYMMSPGHAIALIAASLLVLHVFVYALGFRGEHKRRGSGRVVSTFLRYTLPGYAIALLISLYCLWTFGRLDGVALHEQATMAVVLGFPAALGAATARLVT